MLTKENLEIAKMRAEGNTLTEIGDKIGLGKVGVFGRIARSDEIRETIERLQYEFYRDCLPKAKENITKLITRPADPESKERDLQVKASTRALESAGVLNTGTPNTYIQSIVNVGNDTIRGAYATRTIGEYTNAKLDDGEGIE